MRNFTFDVDADGVALAIFDCAGRPINTVSDSVLDDLAGMVARVRDDPAIRGLLFRSGKSNAFCAGADLGEMEAKIAIWRAAATPDEIAAAVAAASLFSERFRALERCGKPVAVALEGLALGGGLELVLSCHFRAAALGARLRLGFPEAGIGLLPGAGGTQRLPRLMGVEQALPHLLEGTPINVEEALRTGVLHVAVPAEALIETCRRYILDGGSATAPWDEGESAVPSADWRRSSYAFARVGGARGKRYPAETQIVHAVFEGMMLPFDAGLALEARALFSTTRTHQAAAMVRTLFHARQAMAKSGPPACAEAFVTAIRGGWDEAAVGLDAGKVRSVIAEIGGWGPDAAAIPVGDAEFDAIETRLLDAAAAAAAGFAARCGDVDPKLLDLVAVDAGFPAWTGGPLAWRNAG